MSAKRDKTVQMCAFVDFIQNYIAEHYVHVSKKCVPVRATVATKGACRVYLSRAIKKVN